MQNIKLRQRNLNNSSYYYWGLVDGIWQNPKIQDNYIHPMDSEQYTDLKDKNGVEIYEDDNLRINLDGKIYISPVMNRHGCWVIYHPYRLDMHTGEKDYINFGWWTSHDNVEIIGNIYGNPGLLEE